MEKNSNERGAAQTNVETASDETAVFYTEEQLTERFERRWQRWNDKELLKYGKENDPEFYELFKTILEERGFNYAELESDDYQEVLMEGELSFADLSYIAELRWQWTFLAYDIDSFMRDYTIDDLIDTIQLCKDDIADLKEMLTMMGQMSKSDPVSLVLPKKPLMIREEFIRYIEYVIDESQNVILRAQSLLAKRRNQLKKKTTMKQTALGI